ncbi:MAG: two-component regulator propeller domain-containing protein, partial [Acidimicrobiales bacterium]
MAMAAGSDGVLFLALGDGTLVEFDGIVWHVLPDTPVTYAADMAVAADGTLWVASGEEVLAYDGDEWARFTTADGLPSDGISSVAVAPNGDVWVGTADDFQGDPSGGVARFDGGAWTTFDEADGLYASAVTALTVGSDGTVWAVHGGADAAGYGEEPGVSAVSSFNGTTWSAATIADVGAGFGWGAAVDDSGTLWITSRWGVVGFDGAETTVLRVPEGTRPVIEVPHVVVEGGGDILATTVAKAAAPVAKCPAGSGPNQPGPAEQARPPESLLSPVAMDHQSGRVVALVPA